MAINSERYVLASSLIPVKLGDEFDTLPPHITILPPFNATPNQIKTFNSWMAEVAEDYLPFKAQGVLKDRFGDHGEIEVQRIFSIFDFAIHAGALVAAKTIGIDLDPTYTGVDGYSPHVTDYKGVAETGETLLIEGFQLFISRQGLKKVHTIFNREGIEAVQDEE